MNPITVTNTGSEQGIPVFSLGGDTTADFGTMLFDSEADTCGKPVAPGAACCATVRLVAGTLGDKFAYLMLGNARAINLRGVVVEGP